MAFWYYKLWKLMIDRGMTRLRQSRLRAVLLAAIMAAWAGLCAHADIVSNCFKVVDYSVCWHVECTLDGFENALDIVIDDNAHNGFRVGDHGCRRYAYFAAAESGDTIDAGTFIRMTGMVEYAYQSDFIVAFAICCSELNKIDGNFGWVRLAYEGGTIVLKGGAINTTQGSPLVAESGQPPSIVNPETGCETNTFYATSGGQSHILHRRDAAFDFVLFNYSEHCWGVGVEHLSGRGYVATVPAGTYVSDSTFSQQSAYDSYDNGDLFFLAFKWWPAANDTTRRTRYGWLAIGLKDGVPAVLASEMSETAGAPLVARDFEYEDDSGGGDDDDDDLIFDWIVIDRGAYLEIGEQNKPTGGTSGKVTIPSEIDGKPVCSIGEAAFYCHDEITHVVIPETVSNIGYKAFNCCMALERCNIPSGVTNIDEMAFNQTALIEITLPDGLKEIKNRTFGNCESLTNIVLGASVTNIGEMAFCETALTNVTIGAQVEYIGFAAFQGCNIKSVNIWPWTRLVEQPFDLSCWIEYTGTITNFTGFAWDCGYEVTNLIAGIGREHFDGVTELRVCDDYGERYGTEFWYSKLLFNIGMVPAVTQKHGSFLEAKYFKPTMEVVAFDPVLRTITGRVVPQGGCRISGVPAVLWPLGLRVYGSLDSEGDNILNNYPDVSRFADDETLGEFTHTIPEEDFATNRFFRLELIDW